MFKPGDRVKFVWSSVYLTPGWNFLDGAKATVKHTNYSLVHVDWDDHEKGAPPPTEDLRRQGYAWFDGGWEFHHFMLAESLSPFEESVRAYISKELYR